MPNEFFGLQATAYSIWSTPVYGSSEVLRMAILQELASEILSSTRKDRLLIHAHASNEAQLEFHYEMLV